MALPLPARVRRAGAIPPQVPRMEAAKVPGPARQEGLPRVPHARCCSSVPVVSVPANLGAGRVCFSHIRLEGTQGGSRHYVLQLEVLHLS